MRMTTIVALGVALTLGSLAVFLTRGLLNGRGGAASAGGTVVVASQSLPFGATLSADNLAEIPWPSDNVPEGAFATRAELLDGGRRVALGPIQKNEPILVSKVTGPNQRASLSTLIEEGMRAVTVRVDDVRGVAGFVMPGDRVDVVVTRGEAGGSSGTQAFADVLLQNVRVLAVDQATGDRQDKPVVARAVTLELAVQQAQKIILAQGVGRLSLVLRQPGQAESESVRRVTTADLGLSDAVVDAQPQASGPVAAAAPAAEIEHTATILPFKRESVVNVVRGGSKREQYVVRPEQDEKAAEAKVIPLPVARPADAASAVSAPQAALSGPIRTPREF